jgi:hypothetical protein
MTAVRSLEHPDLASDLADVDRTVLRETLVDGIAQLAKTTGSERLILTAAM